MVDSVFYAHSFTDKELEYAKSRRADCAKLRDECLQCQKNIGKLHPDTGRFMRDTANELLKEFRGFDFVVKWITADVGYKEPVIGRELFPYVKMACNSIIYN